MRYTLKEKIDFEKCVKYLEKENIPYQDYDIEDYYIINVFDNTLYSKIESEERAFLRTEKFSIDNGYLVTKNIRKTQ
ncbi:MAG: hypothetical protein E7C03_02880 [Anaerococcus sp.]|nr:hypothetical protein [Anaerococcus sp.]